MEDLLLEWHNHLPDMTPEMSLKNQAIYLNKKYKIETHDIPVVTIDPVTGDNITEDLPRKLIRFKDIVCKYRPHLHLGDYWLNVTIIDNMPNYKFYYIIKETDKPMVLFATHPHLSNGVPCLGNFQGDLGTSFHNQNFIQFLSIMKSYLQAYNGRSTYTRGSAYKKSYLISQLHSNQQICEIFNDEQDTGDFDIYGVAQDSMRWNWPKGLTAWAKLEINGQVNTALYQYFKKVDYPYLKTTRKYELQDFNFNCDAPAQKILGYVYLAMTLGELSLFQAFEFVRVFLLSLQVQFDGDMTTEMMDKLSKLASDVYDISSNGQMYLNTRYRISLDSQNREEIGKLNRITNGFRRNQGNRDVLFIKNLKWGGLKVSNFMIHLRKRSPDKASANNYLDSVGDAIDINGLEKRYNTVKKYAINLALQQLEKDKRRFINEINKPEISNIIGNDGQGTLFSDNL